MAVHDEGYAWMDIRIDEARSPQVLELRFSGRVDTRLIDDLISDVLAEPETRPRHWIVDTTLATVDFASSELAALASRIAHSCREQRRYRIHVIASEPSNFGCMRMLAAHLDGSNIRISVHENRDEALDELAVVDPSEQARR